MEQEEEEKEEEEEQGSVFDRIQPVRHEEHTDPATSTRLGFRLSDGSRLTHRFSKDAPVRVLFEFIKAEVEDARSQPFDVRSNGGWFMTTNVVLVMVAQHSFVRLY